MYEKRKKLWQKHLDFIILDLICCMLSYVIAYVIRHRGQIFYLEEYIRLGIIFAISEIVVGFLTNNYKNIIRRGYYEEFKKVFLQVSLVTLCAFAAMFLFQNAEFFSRTVLILMWCINIILCFGIRVIRKRMVQNHLTKKQNLQKMIIISNKKNIENILGKIEERKYNSFYITCIILNEKFLTEKSIRNIPIYNGKEQLENILQHEVVDEVFIDLKQGEDLYREAIECCEIMGITYHWNLGINSIDSRKNTIIEPFFGYTVLTSSLRVADSRQLLIKRIMDIIGSLIGLAITLVIVIIFGPIIVIQSPGPIFFSQKRVGRNGRTFNMYKLRSMYPDAEKRKAELLGKNKMQGYMFKIDDDPRIIPIGKLLRKLSLDEFPQFFNVLRGDMSLVGTRPPTVDEYMQYEKHHKARLAMKPGLTGMWQVSGRSDIVDFEEVVRLDKKYIEEWNLGLDIKIILQTIVVVCTGKGSV